MFYADLKDKPPGPFKRLTGVRPATFLEMCDTLEKHLPSGGRDPKLCLQDRLLLTLTTTGGPPSDGRAARAYSPIRPASRSAGKRVCTTSRRGRFSGAARSACGVVWRNGKYWGLPHI